jgi:hypothetical protein
MYVGYDHNFALYGTRGSILTDKVKPLEEATSFAKMYEIPNTFEKFFNSQGDIPWAEMPKSFSESQSLSSADLESGIEQAFGIFSFDAAGNDPQEEMLAKHYQKKKKKKKRRSRGIS